MTDPSPRRAAIYCRISQDRTGAGLGVERQEADCRAVAERLGYAIEKVIVDNDTSAYRGKRPGYEELLASIRSGQVDAVIAWHNDRLHRSPLELEHFIALCEERAVTVQTARAGEVDLSTPSGRAVARTLGAWAKHESEHKASRISASRRQQAQKGKWGGGVRPFGFEPDGVTLRVAESDAIRRAFDILLHGGSVRSVIRMLNQAGIRTSREGREWENVTVRQMLLRPRNAGLAMHQKKVVGRGNWPAIVSEEEYNAVVEILRRPERKTTPGTKPRWLGSLIYVCGVCGETLIVGTTGTPRRASYRCRSSIRGGKVHVARAAPRLDEWVEFMVLQRLTNPVYAAAFVQPPAAEVDVPALRRRLATLQQSGRNMSRRLGQELVSDEEFEEFIVENRAKIRVVEAELMAATVHDPVSELIESGDVAGTWNGYQLDERRAVLRRVAQVTVQPSGSRGGRFDPSFIDLEWLDHR